MTTETKQDELVALKERADLMGIKYHPNISLEKLREKVNNALESKTNDSDESDDSDEENQDSKQDTKSVKETLAQSRIRLKKEQLKEIRVNVVCMNPIKKNFTGEYFSVSNGVLGTTTKFVQFNTPWHMPQILVDDIKSKTCSIYVKDKDAKGDWIERQKQIKEYVVEILPSLTQEGLDDLAKQQALNHSIDN